VPGQTGKNPVNHLVDHLFRHESGKMISVLSRLLGMEQMQLAQDIIQDTLLQAMNTWSYNGIPENPSAWLYRVTRNKAIDYLRRNKRFKTVSSEYSRLLQSEWALSSTVNQLFLENEIQDSQLRMMFACCHPSIPPESQVALILKTLCGLSVHEIAHAFLTTDDTITKRIYRAREKIRTEKIGLEVPDAVQLQGRLEAVKKSLYLLFNEGYNSSNPDYFIREHLCEEAIRLCHLLTQHAVTRLPGTYALLSLFCFQASRLKARLDEQDQIIPLKFQDRKYWNRTLIDQGFYYLEMAVEPFEVSSYHLEAAIASLHAASPDFEHTDWRSIYNLYETLYQLQPSPIVAMNKAISSAYAISNAHAINELQKINGLENHYLYYAALGELYLESTQYHAASGYFEKAHALAASNTEKKFLRNKIMLCKQHS
jgi:RNA polymerase sigma factor (sigma-70 family)